MIRSTTILLCATVALTATGCDQVTRIDEGDGGSDSAVPAAVQQRLTNSCAIPGCHVAGVVAPDLSEASGGAWVTQTGGGGPYITFGDVGNSYLITKMFPSPPAGSQMPLPPGELSAEDLAVITGWVAGVEFPEGETTATSGASTDPTGDDADTGDDDGAGESSTGEAAPVLCSLEAIDATATNPIDAGDEAGKIPSSIGSALERNCGCHYVTSAAPPYVPFSGGTQLQTLANFTNTYAGANGQYTGNPAWQAVQDRVVNQKNMPMAQCETDEGISMTEADLALFTAWFEQEAPDGATFVEP
ncbi:MAG: hypothetical protein AAGA54_34500 [Myxococcota bacterium]